jgi:hypothetical protein
VLAPHELAIALEVLGAVPRPAAAVAHWLDGDAVQLSALLHGPGWWHALEVSGRSPERERRIEPTREGASRCSPVVGTST